MGDRLPRTIPGRHKTFKLKGIPCGSAMRGDISCFRCSVNEFLGRGRQRTHQQVQRSRDSPICTLSMSTGKSYLMSVRTLIAITVPSLMGSTLGTVHIRMRGCGAPTMTQCRHGSSQIFCSLSPPFLHPPNIAASTVQPILACISTSAIHHSRPRRIDVRRSLLSLLRYIYCTPLVLL